MQSFGASYEVPYEDISIMTSRQHDPRVIGVWLQNKHLRFMTLHQEKYKLHLWIIQFCLSSDGLVQS